MAQKTLLTLEQFFALPDDGKDYELVHGELVQMPPQDWQHERIKNRICKLLDRYLLAEQGEAFVEVGATIDQDSWRKPDVCVFLKDRLRRMKDDAPVDGTPDLCIE